MTVGNGATTQDPIITIGEVFGGFYSNIAKLSDGKTKRSAVDQTRMQLAQQLLAAELNCAAFGCPAGTQLLISNANLAYAAGAGMQTFISQLDAYNNSGDTITIGPAGKATPKTSQGLANYLFWDNP